MKLLSRLLIYFRRHPRLSALIIIVLLVAVFGYALGSQNELRLYALDPDTGHIAWSIAAPPETVLQGRPAGAKDWLFVATASEPSADKLYEPYLMKLTAYAAKNGAKLWDYIPDQKLLGKISASFKPIPVGDSVLIGVVTQENIGRLIALDAANGKPRWTIDGLAFDSAAFHSFTHLLAGDSRYAPVISDGSTIYAVLTVDRSTDPHSKPALMLVAIDGSTGAKQWQTPFGNNKNTSIDSVTPPVFLSGDTVYVSADQMYAFNARDGSLQDASKVDKGIVVVSNGTRYHRDSINRIMAVDVTTGNVKWLYSPDLQSTANLTGCMGINADPQYVFAFCDLKEFNDKLSDDEEADPKSWTTFLLALDANTGKEVWRKPAALNPYTLAYQMPTVSNGVVAYVGGLTDKFRLQAHKQGDGSALWSFALHDGSGDVTSEGEHFFVTDYAPKLRYWLALLNPAWH